MTEINEETINIVKKMLRKEYNEKKRDHHREYMNMYIKNKPSLICGCGGKYKHFQQYIHNKTKKHIKYLNSLNIKDNNILLE